MLLWPFARTRSHFEREAREWEESGRPSIAYPLPWHVLQLRSWLVSPGGKRASQRLRLYEKALAEMLDAVSPGWYEELLRERQECSRCGQTWLIENTALCTLCQSTFPPCHSPRKPRHQFYNARCPHCRSGEIVG